MPWYAIQHKPAQGDRALANLQNQGASCFYPKIEVERIRGNKRQKRLEPLFPGYLFINIEQTDPLWAKLRSTRGVGRVVSFAGKPAPIDDAVIDHIRDSLDKVADAGGIQPGQPVEVDNGPFQGIQAVFEAYDGEERAIVLMNFMHTQQRVSVPVAGVRKRE